MRELAQIQLQHDGFQQQWQRLWRRYRGAVGDELFGRRRSDRRGWQLEVWGLDFCCERADYLRDLGVSLRSSDRADEGEGGSAGRPGFGWFRKQYGLGADWDADWRKLSGRDDFSYESYEPVAQRDNDASVEGPSPSLSNFGKVFILCSLQESCSIKS